MSGEAPVEESFPPMAWALGGLGWYLGHLGYDGKHVKLRVLESILLFTTCEFLLTHQNYPPCVLDE